MRSRHGVRAAGRFPLVAVRRLCSFECTCRRQRGSFIWPELSLSRAVSSEEECCTFGYIRTTSVLTCRAASGVSSRCSTPSTGTHRLAPGMRPCAISLLRSNKIPRTIIEWLLRQALDRHASKLLIERPKLGQPLNFRFLVFYNLWPAHRQHFAARGFLLRSTLRQAR